MSLEFRRLWRKWRPERQEVSCKAQTGDKRVQQAFGGEFERPWGIGLGWLSLRGPCQGAWEGRLVVAELLFSQQPRKLWIMSLAILGKQSQWSRQSPRPEARVGVHLL